MSCESARLVRGVLTHGLQAFSDTRTRSLADGRPRCSPSDSGPAASARVTYLGAWHQDKLVVLSITAVDDWAKSRGFSTNDARALRPNDTLVALALTDYLAVKQCRLFSYGLSSIQADTNAAGLHEFKRKLGFEAKPVHRAFAIHPLLMPLVNRVTQRGVSAMLALRPGSRMLKKCEGLLSTVRGTRTVL